MMKYWDSSAYLSEYLIHPSIHLSTPTIQSPVGDKRLSQLS